MDEERFGGGNEDDGVVSARNGRDLARVQANENADVKVNGADDRWVG